MVEKQKDTSEADEDFESRISIRQSMGVDQRLKNRIVPVKPLASGKNRDKRPSILFSADQLGSDDGSEEDANDDPMSRMDKLLQNTNSEREGSRIINPIKTTDVPQFSVPVYKPPAYPGPPGSIPTATFPTTTSSPATLAPPTFEYKSAYTNESYKFEGKAYGTVPGQSAIPGIPTASYPLPGSNFQPPTTLPTLEKKTYTLPPSSTRNMVTPESPFTKAQAPQTTTGGGKTMSFKDDETPESGEVDAKTARKLKLQEALRLKAVLQAEKEKNDQQKISGLTTQQLEEKRRVDQEKLEIELEAKALSKLEDESVALKSQIDQFQNEIQLYQQKSLKLNEVKVKLDQAQVLAKQKQESAAIDQQTADSELKQTQSELANQKTQTQNIIEQIAVLKTNRDANNKQISSLNEQKQNIVLALGEDDSHINQITEQAQNLAKNKEDCLAELKLTDSQLLEIRTTGVILDPFLSAKIEEATKKLQVAQAELATNETRLNDLISKLEAANQQEKNQEEESEQMYTDVEVMCQAKETMVEKVKTLNEQKLVLAASLAELQQTQQSLQATLSSRQKYLYDVQSTLNRSSEELKCQEKIRDLLSAVQALENLQTLDDQTLLEAEKACEQEASEVKAETQSTIDFIDSEQDAIKALNEVTPQTNKELQQQEIEIKAIQVQVDQSGSELIQSTEQFTMLSENFSKVQMEKENTEDELSSVLTARVGIIESITSEKDQNHNKCLIELANEESEKKKNEQENIELLQIKTQFEGLGQSFHQSLGELKEKLIQGETKLQNAHKYVSDCTDAQEQGQNGLLLLKNVRLSEIAEAIAAKLEAEREEAQCDLEHSQVREEIEGVTTEIKNYNEAKVKLEEVTNKQNTAETEHSEWFTQSAGEIAALTEQQAQLASEHQKTEQFFTAENDQIERITQGLSVLKDEIQDHAKSADEHSQSLDGLLSLQKEFDQTHLVHQNTLTNEREEFEKEKLERDSLLTKMVETDPEFAEKVQKLTDEINTSTSTNQQLANQVLKLDQDSESNELIMKNVTNEYQELEAKLKELNEENVMLLDQSEQRKQLSQQQNERQEILQNKFAVQEKQLQNLKDYLLELQNMITSANQEFNQLKETRLAEIDETIRDKLDSEQREAKADAELAQLKDQVQEILADLQLTETANQELEKAKEKLRQHSEQLQSWQFESETEHQSEITSMAEVQTNRNELSFELQKLTDLQNDLKLKSEQFQQSLSEVDRHIEEINSQHLAHQTGYEDLQSLFDSNTQTLTNERDGHQLNVQEKAALLANQSETDPEFSTKLLELNEQITTSNLRQAEREKESEIRDKELLEIQANHETTKQLISEALLLGESQAVESQTLNVQNQTIVQQNQTLLTKRAGLLESIDSSKTQLEQFEKYIQECIEIQQSTQIDLERIRTERLQELEDAIRAKFDSETLEQALDLEITKFTDDLSGVQAEISEFESAAGQLVEIKKKFEDLSSKFTTEQNDQNIQQGIIDEEISQIVQETAALQKAALDASKLQEEYFTIKEQLAKELNSGESEIAAKKDELDGEEAQISGESERLARLQGEIEQERKEHGELDDQLYQTLIDRVELIQQIDSDLKLDEKIQALNEAKNEEKVLALTASQFTLVDQQSQLKKLQIAVQKQTEIYASFLPRLSKAAQYEQEVNELLSGSKDQISGLQTQRLKAINEILEQERKRLEEKNTNSSEAAAVQPVINKRRHVRNQSLIGNDLANSTFDSSQPSNLSALDLELKVQEALDRDSQGQKVTIYDLKEETKEIADGGPTNDDEFFSDQMIERKRSSERGRRSSSSHSEKEQPEEGEPQSQFNKDNHLRKLRWANPTLRHIDECSEEQLVSEYGSEVGGHDFGRSGSGVFGLSTSQRLINKSTKLNQFGVVGPQQEHQDNKNQHIRNESAGSVQVPISEEHVEEQSLNLLPTVPEPTIVPVVRLSETRPSIFDMQRKSASQGSYRATTYDKQSSTKRMANAMRQKLGVILEDTHYHEETVLGDLLVCLLSQKQMLSIQSDFEINQGFALFEQMMRDDPKCHEGMFGLGRINYIQGRYEIAEKWLMKAYEVKRDFAYRVWLGFTQMQLYRVCTPENPKKLKFVQNAVANLDRCAKEVKVGIYASFGLLYLSLQLQTVGLQVKGLQEPKYYEQQIRGYSTQVDKYEGELASAIIKLATNQAAAGVKQLIELLVKDRPHAYYVLIHYYLRTNDLVKARQTADEAFNKLTGYENFQERLMITLLLCKCYYKTGNHAKLLVTLQTQLLESPHFSSLLYAYGKYIIQSFKLADYLQSAISALQECMRVSCQVRRAKCAYWLSLAYQATGQLTQCGIKQLIYVNEIKQVVKSGPITIKSVKSRVNVHVQKQVKQQIQRCDLPIQKYSSDVLFTTPQQCLLGQVSDPEWPNDADLTNACQRIPQQRDQLFYRAITLYKIKKDLQQADQIFITLTREHPEDFEIQSENANFLRVAIKNNYQPQRQETPKQEAIKLLEMLESCEVQGDLWANAHVQCAKLLSAIAFKSNDFNLQIKAFECLLKIKNTLPVIDTKIAAVKLPGTVSRYLFDEFDHVDFQASQQAEEEVKEESGFKPQEDYDETNKFFSQSQYFQGKLQSCPLATLSVAEIKDQSRIKGDTVFFFGGAQTELAYEAEEATKEMQENNQLETSSAKIYYQSSTPLICVIKYLQHIRRLNSAEECIEVLPEAVNDFGFCIYSDPSWLFIIAKMCVKWNVYIDLAVHCVQLFLQMVNYYKHFLPVELLDTKGQLLLANILLKISTNQSEDRPVAVAILEQMRIRVAQYLAKANEANNEKAIASALENEKFYHRVTQLLA